MGYAPLRTTVWGFSCAVGRLAAATVRVTSRRLWQGTSSAVRRLLPRPSGSPEFATRAALPPPARDRGGKVTCFDCRRRFTVPEGAKSTTCPQCGSHLRLGNLSVDRLWHEPVCTGGDVEVLPSGDLRTTRVQCSNLTVRGTFSGMLHASGTATFATDAPVFGEIHCVHLVVPRAFRVRFANRVYCDSAEIHGDVTADICCRGQLWITKGASVTGAVLAGRLKLDGGASLDGPMCVLSRANEATIRSNPDFRELATAFDFDTLDGPR